MLVANGRGKGWIMVWSIIWCPSFYSLSDGSCPIRVVVLSMGVIII